MHSGTKNHSKEKPQDVDKHICLFFQKDIVCFWNQPAVCRYAFTFLFVFYSLPVSDSGLALSILFSDVFLPLLSFYFYMYLFLFLLFCYFLLSLYLCISYLS